MAKDARPDKRGDARTARPAGGKARRKKIALWMRKYRARKQAGQIVEPVTFDADKIAALRTAHLLPENFQRSDLGPATARLLETIAKDRRP